MWRRALFLPPAVLVLAGVIGAGVALWPAPDPPPPAPAPAPALPVLNANYRAADRIEVQRGQSLLWLERRGQVWGLSQAGGYPVRPEAATALIDGLLALRLDHTVPGTPEALGVADPTSASGAGTLVRVLAVSGAVLGAIILGPAEGPAYVRRPGTPTVWLASAHITASTKSADWVDPQLPLPDLDHMTTIPSDTADEAQLRQVLGTLRFTDVRSSPQIRSTPLRTIQLALADGTASLALGRLGGQDWLQISGTSGWARRLAPYAFALPAGGPL